MFVRLTIGVAPVSLVLVFAATPKEKALRSVSTLDSCHDAGAESGPSRRNQYGKQNVKFLDV